MRSILAVIPPFPPALLLPAFILLVLGALAVSVNQVLQLRRTVAVPGGIANSAGSVSPSTLQPVFTPFLAAAGLGFLVFIWSNHPITIHSYGFFLVLGFFTAAWNAYLEARRRGYDPEIVVDLALPMLVVTVVMCRLLYVLLDWNQFRGFGDIFRIWDGGLSFHGILPGSFMVIGYYAYTRKIGFATLGDILAPSVFLGYFFGRLGCFFNGCCYGAPCNLPWAVQFHDEHDKFHILMTPPSHPTQLYSAALALLLFAFMQKAKKMPRFTPFPGSLILLFWALYAVERAIVEIFRNGVTASTVFGTTWLTQAQFVSIVGLVVIAVLWVVLDRRAQRRAAVAPAPTAATA